MPLYRTNVALSIKGDRIEKGSEIVLSDDDVISLDPNDITSVDGEAVEKEVVEEAPSSLDEMSLQQLKDRAKELGLSASGSKADLQERIQLHQDGQGDEPEVEGDTEGE